MTLFRRLSLLPRFEIWKTQLYNASLPIEVRMICDDWIEAKIRPDRYLDIFNDPEMAQRAADFTQSLLMELESNWPNHVNDPNLNEAVILFRVFVSRVNPYAVYKQVWDVFWNEQYLLDSLESCGNIMDADIIVIDPLLAHLHVQIMGAREIQRDYTLLVVLWLKENAPNRNATNEFSNQLFVRLSGVVEHLCNIQYEYILERLSRWKREQAISNNGPNPAESIPEKFQMWFDKLCMLLVTTRNTIDAVSILDQLCEVRRDYSHALQQLSSQLSQLFNAGFIVERQPDQVIKTKTKFGARIRMLARNVMGIRLAKQVVVTVSIFSERRMLNHNAYIVDASDEHEVQNTQVSLDQCTEGDHLQWSFKETTVTKVKRSERTGNSTVTDEKFALLFQAKFGNTTVHALSLPVVFIVHANQYPQAWATISWDNAFSDFYNRTSFEVPDAVSWGELAKMLNLKCEQITGRGLTYENELCLYGKLMRTLAIDTQSPDQPITWRQFCKDALVDPATSIPMRFNFWEWFYAALKQAKLVNGFWINGFIDGFISKEQARTKLLPHPVETGLVRFSDSDLSTLTIAYTYNKDNIKLVGMFKFNGPLKNKDDFVVRRCCTVSTPRWLAADPILTIRDVFRNESLEKVNNTSSGTDGYKKLIVTYVVDDSNNPPDQQ